MKLGYTEFSYGYGFTENLIRSSATAPTGAPQFPNLVQEAKLGYDVRIDLPACPIFFQFKLPELLVRDTAKEISQWGLAGIRCNFFRMPLMKRNLSRQHQHLINLERIYPHQVFYASPKMESVAEFNRAYNNAEVHRRSALFSPTNIGPLPDDKQHVVSYRDGSPIAWRCSRPEELKMLTFDDVLVRASNLFEEPRFRRADQIATVLVSELIEAAPANIRNNMQAIEARVIERVRSADFASTIEPQQIEVVEKLIAAREIARMGLGVEMVIAQPQNTTLDGQS